MSLYPGVRVDPSFPPPDVIDRNGHGWKVETVNRQIVRAIAIGWYFREFAKMRSEDINTATEMLDEATDRFNRSLHRFVSAHTSITTESKKASGEIRKATDSLAQGIARIEKQADFSRLEHYVELLERAAEAIQVLATLEQQGRLEKIAGALK